MKILNILLAIVLAACLLIACKQATSNQQTKNEKTLTPANSVQLAKTQNTPEEAKRISVEDAKAALDAGKAVIIDVRGPEAYKDKHIKGALEIQDVAANTDKLPKDKQIIIYCSWPHENSSARAVLELKEKGITNAAALLGGTAAWEKAGYPMEEGTKKK